MRSSVLAVRPTLVWRHAEGALTEEVNWEDELSLGEKQRLAIARLVHHKPRYAILDECSSAISAEMERRLYRICQQNSITYITIAHRPALRVTHSRNQPLCSTPALLVALASASRQCSRREYT
jgi:ABC-type uncharacterized transport system fused permease/ATPase subunit